MEIARGWGKKYMDGQGSWFYNLLGFSYHKTGQYKKVKKIYKEAELYTPDDRWIIRNRAVLSFAEELF